MAANTGRLLVAYLPEPEKAVLKGVLQPPLDVNKVAAGRPGWGHATKDPTLASEYRKCSALGGMPPKKTPIRPQLFSIGWPIGEHRRNPLGNPYIGP